jgi:hypothetical protein
MYRLDFIPTLRSESPQSISSSASSTSSVSFTPATESLLQMTFEEEDPTPWMPTITANQNRLKPLFGLIV